MTRHQPRKITLPLDDPIRAIRQRRYANEMRQETWETWVGDQTPVEFMKLSDSDDPREAVETYVADCLSGRVWGPVEDEGVDVPMVVAALVAEIEHAFIEMIWAADSDGDGVLQADEAQTLFQRFYGLARPEVSTTMSVEQAADTLGIRNPDLDF